MKKEIKLLGICFIVLMFVYMPFMHQIYASDMVYSVFFFRENPEHKLEIIDYIAGGRPLSFIIYHIINIFELIGVNEVNNQYVLQIFSIFIYAICIALLYHIFSDEFQNKKNNVLVISILLVGFINPFILETFTYTAAEFALGMLPSVIAVYMFSKRKFFFSFLFCFLSVCAYQSNYAIFLIYALAYIFSATKENGKKILKYKLYAVGICAGAIVLNLVIGKGALFFGVIEDEVKATTLHREQGTFLHSLWKAIYEVVIQSYDMMPHGFLIITAMVLLLGGVFLLYKEKNRHLIGWYIIDVIMIMGTPFAICLVMEEPFWLPQRVMHTIFMSISMLLLLNIRRKEEGKMSYLVFTIFTIVFISVNWYYTSTAILDSYISNAMDLQYMEMLQEEIEEYEEETGIEIIYIAARKMPYSSYTWSMQKLEYKDITYNHKLVYDAWSDVELLNLYMEENYIDLSYTENSFTQEKYEELFGDKIGGRYNPSEQLVFEGNTLYWAIY